MWQGSLAPNLKIQCSTFHSAILRRRGQTLIDRLTILFFTKHQSTTLPPTTTISPCFLAFLSPRMLSNEHSLALEHSPLRWWRISKPALTTEWSTVQQSRSQSSNKKRSKDLPTAKLWRTTYTHYYFKKGGAHTITHTLYPHWKHYQDSRGMRGATFIRWANRSQHY